MATVVNQAYIMRHDCLAAQFASRTLGDEAELDLLLPRSAFVSLCDIAANADRGSPHLVEE